MKTHILIHSSNSYGIMVLIALSLGSFTIARHVHIRWLKDHFSFIASNAIVKSIIVLFGLCTISVNDLFCLSIYSEMNGIFIGFIFGFITIFSETVMVRMINRKKIQSMSNKACDQNNSLRNAVIKNKLSLSSSVRAKGLTCIRQNYNQYAAKPNFLNYSILAVIIVAIAEEFLFRGYMISIAQMQNSKIILVTIIFSSTLLFACSHVSSTWNEFKCKLPLSVLTLIGFLITGTLISSITTHVLLNIYAYLHMKQFNFENIIKQGQFTR